MASHFNAERTKKTIADILEKIQTEADPVVLNKYRSLIRKESPLFRRSYVGAYLLMCLEEGPGGRRSRHEGETENPREPARHLPEEESTRLFISIGRNRRVFPREILGLISAKTQVPRDHIGTIRILDNYSFVQVHASAADPIIEALNGSFFRGRTLSVNYARNQKEGAETGDQENLAQQKDDYPDKEGV